MRYLVQVGALLAAMNLSAAIPATERFVEHCISNAMSTIKAPDYSRKNATLVATIKAESPPADYSRSNSVLCATIRAESPAPDFSENNAALVSTINATAPSPKNYPAVSNAAMHADQAVTVLSGRIDEISDAVYSEYAWQVPDDWAIDFEMSETSNSVKYATETTDGFRVISNMVVDVTSSLSADAWTLRIDETSRNPAPNVEWSALPPGCSIDSAGHFSAVSDGVYRVSARASDGTVRYADIAINADRTESETNVIQYVRDVAGTVRAAVNDAALAIMTAAERIGTGTYDGKEYGIYSTFVPRMTSPGAGNVRCWAVSQHILASAKHYAVKPLGEQTFSDGTTTATVRKLQWVNLADWAKTNGWTEAEVKSIGFSFPDIMFIRCDKTTAVPDGCVPYFMDDAKCREYFGAPTKSPSPLDGVVGWIQPQNNEYAVPVLLRSESWLIASLRDIARLARPDIADAFSALGDLYPIHSGDSGRPCFVMINGVPVVVFQFMYAGAGPTYTRALEIVRAFVEDYGDTLKEVE